MSEGMTRGQLRTVAILQGYCQHAADRVADGRYRPWNLKRCVWCRMTRRR